MTGLFLSIGAGQAGLRCTAEDLFPGFTAQGVHIAVMTIGTDIAPGSKNAEAVGEAFAYTPSRETNGCGKPATAEPPVITSTPWADSAPTPNNLKI